jgi:hypothetical protein
MKKEYFSALFICISAWSFGQIVNIPDANFKNKLLLSSSLISTAIDIDGQNIAVDANSDNEISTAEALAVYYLDVDSSSIANLTGVEAFTNLKGLWCYQNNLTELPIADLVNLESVYCRSNALSNLSPLENLVLLTDLTIDDNPVTTINLQNLHNLWRLQCSRTLLSEINLCGTAVSFFWCEDCLNLQTASVKNNVISPQLRSALEGTPPGIPVFNFANTPLLTNICYDEGELNAVQNSGIIAANVSLTNDCEALCAVLDSEIFTADNTFELTPNPVESMLNITFNNVTAVNSISIYNMLGQKVKSVDFKENSSIDVSQLKKGTYFIEITSNSGKTTKKFVKI